MLGAGVGQTVESMRVMARVGGTLGTKFYFVCPGQTESRGRLQGVAELRLAGLELTDASLRLLLRHAPQLSALDLSHCAHVGDPSVHLLTAPTSPLRETLVHLNLAGKWDPLYALLAWRCGFPVYCLLPTLVSVVPLYPQDATVSRTTAFHCSVAAHVFAAWTYAPAASSHLKLVPGWQLLDPLAPFAAQKRSYFSRTASWVPVFPSPRTPHERLDLAPSFHPLLGGQVIFLHDLALR